MSHFLLDCPNVREHFDYLWADLTDKVTMVSDTDGRQISEFIAKLVSEFIAKLDRTRKSFLRYSWDVFLFLLTLPRLP